MENELNPLQHIASALNRKDEVPNQELATRLASTENHQGIQVLVENVRHKEKAVQHDCIKVLYEIGTINAALIEAHYSFFSDLLHHKNNRLQWGAMTAIASIAKQNAALVFKDLPSLIEVAMRGSVITRDQLVQTLIHICGDEKYATAAVPLLLEQLLGCPMNQFPMYAERSFVILESCAKERFLQVLNARLNEVEKESKRKRITKLIRRLSST